MDHMGRRTVVGACLDARREALNAESDQIVSSAGYRNRGIVRGWCQCGR